MLRLEEDIQNIKNNTVVSLDYSDKEINDIDADKLTEALKNNYSVTKLIISQNKINYKSLTNIVMSCKDNLGTIIYAGEFNDFGLYEEFYKITNTAKKYHIARLISSCCDTNGARDEPVDLVTVLRYKNNYENKVQPAILSILACQNIYNKKHMGGFLLNKEVFLVAAKMLDKVSLISFKMAIDDALDTKSIEDNTGNYEQVIVDNDTHHEIEVNGDSSSYCILL